MIVFSFVFDVFLGVGGIGGDLFLDGGYDVFLEFRGFFSGVIVFFEFYRIEFFMFFGDFLEKG